LSSPPPQPASTNADANSNIVEDEIVENKWDLELIYFSNKVNGHYCTEITDRSLMLSPEKTAE
tara:strand:- start:365 stop:553 length:189 start_codon:yes stop_codon:yes gene_type:complete